MSQALPPSLSPAEVAALRGGAAAAASNAPTAVPPHGLGGGDGVRAYDLTSHERMVRGPMPAMDLVHERLARHLRAGLTRFLQRSADVVVRPVRVQRFDAFLAARQPPAGMHLMRVRPLRGMALVLCDPALVAGVIETLFGGAGTPAATDAGSVAPRELSATEHRVVQRLVETFAAEYARSWLPMHPLSLEYARGETDPRFAQIALPAEMVVTTSVDITLGELTGAIYLGIPLGSFEPIRDVLLAQPRGEAGASDRRFVDLLVEQIKSATVELVAELAHGEATVRELLTLKKGDFIELDRHPTLVAKVDGVPLIECDYGTASHRYGLRVREFLTHPAAEPPLQREPRRAT